MSFFMHLAFESWLVLSVTWMQASFHVHEHLVFPSSICTLNPANCLPVSVNELTFVLLCCGVEMILSNLCHAGI